MDLFLWCSCIIACLCGVWIKLGFGSRHSLRPSMIVVDDECVLVDDLGLYSGECWNSDCMS